MFRYMLRARRGGVCGSRARLHPDGAEEDEDTTTKRDRCSEWACESSMFVIEPSIMLARATAYASGRRSMIGKPAPRGARPRAGTRGHLGLTVVVIRGDVVGIDNVVAVATELVVVVSQLERRVIGEGTAGTERVVVVRQLLRGVIFESTATERVVVAMERLEMDNVCELPHANASTHHACQNCGVVREGMRDHCEATSMAE